MRTLLTSVVVSLSLLTANASHADDTEDVKIGVLTSLTGSVAEWGQNTREGMDLALSEVNAERNDQGKRFKIVYEDFGDVDLKKAATGAQRLLQFEKVNVLLTQWTEDTEVAWPLALRQNVLTLTYAAGGRNITKGRKLLFRVWPSDEPLIRRVIQYAATISKEDPCIVSEQAAYFESMRAVADEEWVSIKGKRARSVEYESGVSDLRPYLAPLRECSSILVLTSQNLLPTMLRQLKLTGTKALLISYPLIAALSAREAVGLAADGVVYGAYRAATKEFTDRFTQRWGRSPGLPAASAYDAIKVLAHSIDTYGLSSDQIAAGLMATRDFPGASGLISFTQDGDRAPLPSDLWKVVGSEVKILQ